MIERIKQLISRAVNHEGLKLYGMNTSWLFMEKVFRMAVGFTVGIYVARQLGPEKYGLLNYAISFVAIFSVIAGFGLDSIVVRELVKYPDKRDRILGSTITIKLAGFILMLTGIGIALYFSSNDYLTNLMILIIAAGYLFQIFQTIEFYFQAKVLSKYVAISQIIAWTVVSCGRAFCAWKGYPLVYFAGLEALNMCLMSSGYLLFYIIKVSRPFLWRFDSGITRELLKASWPLFLSGAAGIIYMRIDQVMINAMLGNEATGQYALAIRFCELWYIIPMILRTSFFPSIVRAKDISVEHYHNRLQLFFTLMTWLAVSIAVVMTILSPLLKIFLPQYANASKIIMVYIWVLPVIFWSAVNGSWQIAESRFTLALVLSIINAVLNVMLNYFLIHEIGLFGAAWATLGACFTTIIIIQSILPQTRLLVTMILKSFFPVFLLSYLKNNEG